MKLRIRRWWRRRLAQVLAVFHQAGESLEKYLLSRFGRLRAMRRFVFGWLILFVLLAGCLVGQLEALRGLYQVIAPVPGGHYIEGLAGSFTTANPLYAVSDVDVSVSRLLFASLLKYNDQNQLVGDLADSWTVDATGKLYTVHLRPGLTWQDGMSVTANDVAFTYHTIQNPDAQSPLFTSWRGAVVTATDPQTVTFALPNPLTSFPYSLTNGIVPEHILQKLNATDLRSASFNTTDPVGAGPLRWSSIGVTGAADTTEVQITLLPFMRYWAGAPKLDSLGIYAYADTNAMIQAYANQEITAMAGLDSVPATVAKDSNSHIYSLPLTAGTYVFFRTAHGVLADTTVRQALVAAADREAIVGTLPYQAGIVNGPLLRGQLGYDLAYAQATNNVAQAKALLDGDGWIAGPNGIRSKSGQKLVFTLSASNTPDNQAVVRLLQREWRLVGADVQLVLQSTIDFQGTLQAYADGAVLDGISIGVDPDVFVYWDSSQSDPRSSRLNFSEYNSATADLALEAGRTRLDTALRVAKYKSFLQAWQQDAPALALYQPRLLYISHETVYGLSETPINTDDDRFRNVQNWMIHESWVTLP